ncbi:hypothetical protein ABEB36_015307 [Hypothenemus hampei]|uniref:Uncharacterized protein n=1 Tax=Hypothenemus hampei TaxID=57062 RepID=A0ABD1E1U2_HYPHA
MFPSVSFNRVKELIALAADAPRPNYQFNQNQNKFNIQSFNQTQGNQRFPPARTNFNKNQTNSTNVFRPNTTNPNQLPKPTPMSISTNNTYRPQGNRFAPDYRNRQNIVSEELFNIEEPSSSLGKQFELMSLTDDESQLTYIVLPENNLKVLIDCASTKSFVKPEIAEKYFKNNIVSDPFQVTTTHGTSSENYSIEISPSKLFKTKENVKIKYYLFNFHKYFNCLLGLNNLRRLGVQIDLVNDQLKLPNGTIKLKFYDVVSSTNCIVVKGRSDKLIQLNIKNVIEIPECVTKVRNHKAICIILNPNEPDMEITLLKPINVEKFDEHEISKDNNLNSFELEKIQFDL